MPQQEQLVWRCQNITLQNADDKGGLRPCSFHPILSHGITKLHTAMPSLEGSYPVELGIVFYLIPPATSRSPINQNGTMAEDALFTGKFIRAECVR